jgi:hypothetical protein
MSGWFPNVRIDAAERRHMRQLTRLLRTKADKIRILAAAGYSRQKIASFLGIRYQHVRNVLVRSAPVSTEALRPRGLGEHAPEPPKAWEDSAPDGTPTYGRVVVDEEGRIALSPNVLAALDSGLGRPIPWRFEDGELKLMNRAAGIRAAQAMVADLAKKHPGSWSDALIAERRAEAAREDERYRKWRRG